MDGAKQAQAVLDNAQLAELEKLGQQATQGEWIGSERETDTPEIKRPDGSTMAAMLWPCHPPTPEATRAAELEVYATVDFIVAAHNALPALLAEVRAARQRFDEFGDEMLENLDTAIGASYEEGATACFELRKAIPNLDRFITDEIAEAARQEWTYVDSGIMPKQYDSALIAHTETVEEAQWDGESWTLVRTEPCGDVIRLREQVYAWRPLPSAPPEPSK